MRNGSGLRVAAVAAPAVVAVAALLLGQGCGSARKLEGTAPPTGGELQLEIVSLQLPGDGGETPRVTFRAMDRAGNPIDVLAELGRAASKTMPYLSNGPRFTLAQVESDGSTTSWYETTAQPGAFTPPAGGTVYAQAATQPGFQQAPAADPGSRIKANGDGTFTITFAAPSTDAARRDATKPLTVGVWADRVAGRATGSPKRWPAAATRTFVQGGGTPPAPHEAVSDQACNTCHVVMRAHDRRETVQLCKTCHSGSVAAPYRDPESGEDLDFRAMIHRIHAGELLPSVRAGGAFYIVGRNQAIFDFSEGQFPPLREATDCVACHQGGADADAWKTKASFTACNACHDNVRYDGSVGTDCRLGEDDVSACDHPLSPEIVNASSTCASCHTPGASAPAIGPDVVHKNDTLELAAQWKYEILQVTVPGDRKPVVRFRVSKNGAASDVKNDPVWKVAVGGASRLFVDIAWPLSDITNEGAGYVDAAVKPAYFPSGTPGQGLPVQVNALAASTPVAGETNVFEVTSPTAIPEGVAAVRVVLEGHPAETVGPAVVRVPVANAVLDVAVGGGAPAPRREIVSAESCNACHASISAHGANRNATPAACVVCHTPRATDFIRRVQASPAAPPTEEAAIDFKVLVHAIHGADIRRTKITVFGFGGTPNEFPAAFPGSTGRCTVCHVGDSYQLPLAPEVQDTTVRVGDPTTQDLSADAAEVRLPRTQAICASCHDMVRFDAGPAERPLCNTLVPANTAECSHSGGAQADEAACAACHGRGAQFDVAKVHPITEKPQ